MKIELQDVESCVKKISIEVPIETINEEKSAVYDELAKTVDIPGFRKGKIPRKVLEKRMSKSVLAESAQRLMDKAYREAIESNKLQPISEPKIDNVTIEEDVPLSFTATIETFPEFEIGDITGLEFERKIAPVTDASVDNIVNEMRERHARFEPVDDRAIEEDDYPLLDYSATKDGEEVSMLKGENKQVNVSKTDMLKGFHENVLGMKKGEEKEFDAQLPKEFPDPELAEANIHFKVKVNEIKKKVLPEPDDDFAKETSQFETMAELRDDLRQGLEERNNSMADEGLRNEIMNTLIEKNPFDLPPGMIDKTAESMAKQAGQRFAAGGGDLENSGFELDKVKEDMRDNAIREIKEEAIMAEFAKKENTDVSEEDLDKEIDTLAKMMGQPMEETRNQLANSGGINGLYHKVFKDKVFNEIKNKVTIKDQIIEVVDDK